MANVLLNALASTAGGGITYLKNVLPRLSKLDSDNRYIAIVPAEHADLYSQFHGPGVAIEPGPANGGVLKRLFWEQTALRKFIGSRRIDILVSLGNFALLASPVPQILFSRNDLYFSDYFERDLRSRKLYGEIISHRIKSRLARISIRAADLNVTPTRAFAERIRSFDGMGDREFRMLKFGFDQALFSSNDKPLSGRILSKLNSSDDCYRLLYVSHYNYFRNFETLIRALPIIKQEIKNETGKDIQLVLTTDIKRGAVYGGYDASVASDLIDRLGVRGDIAMLGAVAYEDLAPLYRKCDLFVCPSYSESFGHPLVEAMASGLPVVSADLPVHREVCEDAAIYFDVFDEHGMAAQCVRALTDDSLKDAMKEKGEKRSQSFSWDEHVEGLIKLITR